MILLKLILKIETYRKKVTIKQMWHKNRCTIRA